MQKCSVFVKLCFSEEYGWVSYLCIYSLQERIKLKQIGNYGTEEI